MPNDSFLSQFEVRADQRKPLALLVFLVLLLLFFYWSTLRTIAAVWNSPEYSHGWLVPLFAVVLMWLRREPITEPTPGARQAGIGLLAVSLALRLAGTYIGYTYLDMISLIPALFGIFLVVGGWSLVRWSGPALGFLIFMYPLPAVVSRGLLDPLQRVATVCSTFAIQTMGIAAYRSGNHIILGELRLGVVDACSGLRMSTIFLALAVAITLVTQRPWWERITIILSAVPIALLVNIIRITVTGILHQTVGTQIADAVFHDLAGWVMMPMAMGFLFIELQLLSHLFLEDADTGPVSVGPMGLSSGPRIVGGAPR